MALVALVVILVVPLPTASLHPGTPTEGPTSHSLVFRTDAPWVAIARAGAEPLETYSAFTVALGSPGSLLQLEGFGYYASPISEVSSLQLLGGPMDLAAIASGPISGWPIDSGGATLGVVHFHAPIKADWMTAMESLGLHVLRYMPQDAFIARGPPAAFQSIATVAAVDWSGPYAADWKLPRGIAAAGLSDVRI